MKTLIAWIILAASVAGIRGADTATVLITGSDRGLGFEFTKEYAERGWTVIATARHPEAATALNALAANNRNIVVERLDVTDLPGIKALAAKYAGKPIDLLINNAGFGGDLRRQSVGTYDYADFKQVMDVNAFGPLAVSEAFRDSVILSGQKKIVAITSGAGSSMFIGHGSGATFYRASKSALNMGMRELAHELRDKGVIVGIVAPGGADTGHHVPGLFVDEATYHRVVRTPAQSVGGMIKVIDGLTQANCDKLYNYDGTVLPW